MIRLIWDGRIFDRLYCKECTGTDTGRYVGSEEICKKGR